MCGHQSPWLGWVAPEGRGCRSRGSVAGAKRSCFDPTLPDQLPCRSAARPRPGQCQDVLRQLAATPAYFPSPFAMSGFVPFGWCPTEEVPVTNIVYIHALCCFMAVCISPRSLPLASMRGMKRLETAAVRLRTCKIASGSSSALMAAKAYERVGDFLCGELRETTRPVGIASLK